MTVKIVATVILALMGNSGVRSMLRLHPEFGERWQSVAGVILGEAITVGVVLYGVWGV